MPTQGTQGMQGMQGMQGTQGTLGWYSKEDPYTELFGIIRNLRKEQTAFYSEIRDYFANYLGRSLDDNLLVTKNGSNQDLLVINVSKNLIDTATSKIGTKKVKPMFLTEDGTWEQKERAQGLNEFFVGFFEVADFYKTAREVFRDASICGTGFAKIYAEEDEVCVERVLADEIVVDPRECKYGKPRQFFQEKQLDRGVVIAAFPEKEDFLMYSTLRTEDSTPRTADTTDLITVIEAWHLPAGNVKGRHVICTSNTTLYDEEWEKEYFPFAICFWTAPPVGFWGIGIPAEIASLERETNFLHRKIQEQMDYSQYQLIAPRQANLNEKQVGGGVGTIIEYDAGFGDIQPFSPNTVSPETFARTDQLESKCYEITGVSRLSAQAQKPQGIDSGVAIREFYDIESERFQGVGQIFEEFVMRVTDIVVDSMEEVEDFQVTSTDSGRVKRLKWKDVYLPRDQYVMQRWPTNLLPATPTGKFQKVQEMIQTGLIPPELAPSLLDYPDIKQVTDLLNAPRKAIEKALYSIVHLGKARLPNSFTDLNQAGNIAALKLEEAVNDNAPEERIQMLQEYIDEVKRLIDLAAASAMPAPGLPPPVPGSPPAPGAGPGQLNPAMQVASPIPGGVLPQ